MQPPTWLLRLVCLLLRLVTDRMALALAPPRCAACDRSLPALSVFCFPCASTVIEWPLAPERAAPTGIDQLHAFASYGGAIADGIRRFKYEDRPDLARQLGSLLARRIRFDETGCGWDAITAVPLHPRRLAERGYNQAVLLARCAATQTGSPVWPRALRRRRATRPQAELPANARSANVRDAFQARHEMAGLSVLLVDDVCTTGATLTACARALRHAGVVRVDALVIARADQQAMAQQQRGNGQRGNGQRGNGQRGNGQRGLISTSVLP